MFREVDRVKILEELERRWDSTINILRESDINTISESNSIVNLRVDILNTLDINRV